MNIIFLDLDGVLGFDMFEINPESLKILKEIIERYDAKIVLISSNLGFGTISEYKKLCKRLNDIGIINIIDKIDLFLEGDYCGKTISNRVWGIIDYLVKHRDINYVIFDDEYSKQYKRFGLNYVRPNSYIGLRHKDLKDPLFAHNNLTGTFDYKYKSIEDKPYLKATNDLVKVMKKVYNKRLDSTVSMSDDK